MSHSDLHAPDDLLALHATGEPLPEAMARHVEACQRCLVELEQWRGLVSTVHTVSPQDTPTTPPAHVWEQISAELDLQRSRADEGHTAPVVALAPARRRWSTAFLVAATVAGLLVGGVATLGAGAMIGSEPSPPVVAAPVVAQTQLAALPQHEGQGAAEIVRTSEGTELVVDVSGLSGGDGFYEVWLIDPKTFAMVGLGALTADSGRFPVPDGLDLSQYRVVDVSLEPFDGDPVHSRDSVVRGELST